MKDGKRGDAMFGAIYGDVIGSYYEVHCTKAYDFPLMAESSFTDDSVLIAAVCRAILDDPQPISRLGLGKRACVYAAKYRQYYAYFPHAGFGNLFAAWASHPGTRNGHSYGNGAAMRVIPIGYAYDTMEQTLLQAKASCLPTHNNREAITGDFFVLSTGIAGEILQKFVNYGFKLAVYGDFTHETSAALQDFIRESNEGRDIFFQPDANSATEKLARAE